MKLLITCVLLLSIIFCLFSCKKTPSLKDELLSIKEQWGYKFPLPSENDSINLLAIQMERAYFNFEPEKMDLLANRILAIDSSFYMAISFQAFKKWPFDLEKLEKARIYALKDTSVHRLVFEGDYSYWIQHDTANALKTYLEVYKRYPDSKVAAWLAGMACLWSEDYSRALDFYRKTIEIDPGFFHAYYDIGDTYLQSNQYEKAIENFKVFLTYLPNKYQIHDIIGHAYSALNDSVNSIKHLHYADSLKQSFR